MNAAAPVLGAAVAALLPPAARAPAAIRGRTYRTALPAVNGARRPEDTAVRGERPRAERGTGHASERDRGLEPTLRHRLARREARVVAAAQQLPLRDVRRAVPADVELSMPHGGGGPAGRIPVPDEAEGAVCVGV